MDKKKSSPTKPKKPKGLNEKYNSLTANEIKELKDFVKNKLGRTSRATLNNWLRGKTKCSTAEQTLIAEHLKVSRIKLFGKAK